MTLSADQLDAVQEAVRVIVEHDLDALAAMAPGLDDVEYLYEFTHDYGEWGTVELVMPPRPAEEWPIDVTDTVAGSKHLAVGMWTEQEGRSDLTLELELVDDESGRWRAEVLGLHVL